MASASRVSPMSHPHCQLNHRHPHLHQQSSYVRLSQDRSVSMFRISGPGISLKSGSLKVSCSAFNSPSSGDGDGNSQQSGGNRSPDLKARHKRLQDIAARMKQPWFGIVSGAGKRLQSFFDEYRKNMLRTKQVDHQQDSDNGTETVMAAINLEWDWERWKQHFAEVEEQESLGAAFKLQLEDAIKNENFVEAASLKSAIAAAVANDVVSEVLTELQKALALEDYNQASRLRDNTGVGLGGWWVGRSQGEDDSYGRIVHISSAYGRFVAKGYSARHLRQGSSGIPLFEVFLRKDSDGYHQQAVYLQREALRGIGIKTPKSESGISVQEIVEEHAEMKSKDLEGATDEEVTKARDVQARLNHIIGQLKDRLPGMKVKVFNVVTDNEEDIPKLVEEILEAAATREAEDEKGQKMSHIEGELSETNRTLEDGISSQQEASVRLIVGGMLEHSEEEGLRVPVRVPAKIENQGKDSFILHIDESASQKVSEKETPPRSLRIATVSVQASANLVPPDVTTTAKKVQVSKDIGEFLRIAISQVQRQRGLSKCTIFSRIKLTEPSSDPLSGFYVGAFGPNTSELVQLRQKFGHWYGETNIAVGIDNLEFFEYVEAVKVSGDLNIPSGQIMFRAKIGKENRLVHNGIYPEEMGVVARYKGQGRLVEPGLNGPQWVDGELLLLDGKGMGYMNGAALGFIYSIPDRHLLVLFSRVKLDA